MISDLDAAQIEKWLDEVKDPEIPVLSIKDLGVLRSVALEGEKVVIEITPTYSGCPAMDRMEADIEECLQKHGIDRFEVRTIIEPAWTTDWLTQEAKDKLSAYGIAPPVDSPDKSILFGNGPDVPCPQCGSVHTEMVSQFGSTACKALYKCLDCKEPFDYFKCLK